MKEKKLKISVVEIVLWVIGIALLAVVFFRKNIFPQESIFYNLYEDLEVAFPEQGMQVLVKIIKTQKLGYSKYTLSLLMSCTNS